MSCCRRSASQSHGCLSHDALERQRQGRVQAPCWRCTACSTCWHYASAARTCLSYAEVFVQPYSCGFAPTSVACFRLQLDAGYNAEILALFRAADSLKPEVLRCSDWCSVAVAECKLWNSAAPWLWTGGGYSRRRHSQRRGSGCPGQHRRPEQRAGQRFSAQHSRYLRLFPLDVARQPSGQFTP